MDTYACNRSTAHWNAEKTRITVAATRRRRVVLAGVYPCSSGAFEAQPLATDSTQHVRGSNNYNLVLVLRTT
jgi:hypothetical protein